MNTNLSNQIVACFQKSHVFVIFLYVCKIIQEQDLYVKEESQIWDTVQCKHGFWQHPWESREMIKDVSHLSKCKYFKSNVTWPQKLDCSGQHCLHWAAILIHLGNHWNAKAEGCGRWAEADPRSSLVSTCFCLTHLTFTVSFLYSQISSPLSCTAGTGPWCR